MKNKPTKPSENSSFDAWPFFIKGREDIIFIHIVKTAGTSMRHSLGFHPPQKEIVRKHNDAISIITKIGQEKWDNAYKFTFVRNPWDRLLSSYYFRLRKNKISNEAHQNSFKKWAFHYLLEYDITIRSYRNLKPQVQWLKDNEGKINIDFIGRFEQLNRDYEQLTKTLSLPSELMHVNKNPNRLDYRAHYDSELKLLVARFYEEDLDYFKYVF